MGTMMLIVEANGPPNNQGKMNRKPVSFSQLFRQTFRADYYGPCLIRPQTRSGRAPNCWPPTAPPRSGPLSCMQHTQQTHRLHILTVAPLRAEADNVKARFVMYTRLHSVVKVLLPTIDALLSPMQQNTIQWRNFDPVLGCNSSDCGHKEQGKSLFHSAPSAFQGLEFSATGVGM
jgi:hypothetical protein